MVVAHQGEHAAMFRRTGEVDVAEHIAAAIDAGALAVPKRENAVKAAFAAHFRLLRAPDGRRGQILVETGLKQDVVGVEDVFGAYEIMIEAAERRTGIAGDEPRRIQSRAPVKRLLHEKEPRHGLRAGNIDPLFGEVILIGEGDIGQRAECAVERAFHHVRHCFLSCRRSRRLCCRSTASRPRMGRAGPAIPDNPYRTGQPECQDF